MQNDVFYNRCMAAIMKLIEKYLVESITAVYNQTFTVYEDTPLDDLKSDLVVTAEYADGTSEEVPADRYTLSGELVEGTSAVTVSYGGKTTTFNVTVSPEAVVLDSISAVYTQSGTVYDTDSLDSLKSDLVVTATYSDSSTETVPSTDYTLSGTLTVGTSTIYVVYSDKTTTFSVTVTSWKNKMYYSSENGDLGRYDLSSSWDSTHGLYVSTVTNNKRRTFTLPYGERSYRYTTNNSTYANTSEYYPIPIPSSATSVVVSVIPATMYHGASFFTLSDGEYTRQADPGWKQGSFTHTFTAGQYDYMSISCKKDSTGTVFTTEPELTITFS